MDLLKTIHGSRLYGTDHADSDFDLYVVSDSHKTGQSINGLDDLTVVNIQDFISHANKGTPQALEALWSPVKTVDPAWEAFFNGIVPNFESTLKNFSAVIYSFYQKDTDKHRLHAMRLSLNLRRFVDRGKFNPVLGELEVPLFRRWATSTKATRKFIDYTCPMEVFN